MSESYIFLKGGIKSMIILAVVLLIFFSLLQSENPERKIGFYKLKKQKIPISIPFKMINGKPVMNAKLNGIDAKLMIDNGRLWDQIWLFGTPLADNFVLKENVVGNIGGAGSGQTSRSDYAENLTLDFKPVCFYEQEAFISSASDGFTRMFPGVDGQISNTFFGHFVVQFDFIKNKILLFPPDQFKIKGEYTVVDMTPEKGGAYSIPISITLEDGRTISKQADLDFGGIHILLIGLNNENRISCPTTAKKQKSFGVQGECEEFSGKIRELKIDNQTLEYPSVVFSDEKNAVVTPNNLGIIGLPLFMKYHTAFDYFNNKLYLIKK